MKQIIIGDIHGRPVWKTITGRHNDADRIIFIGDYLDTHEDILPIEQLNNLEGIINFKKESKKEVILLIGNHDHHYWPGVGNSGTSGYQPKMAPSFEHCLNENKDLFQMCFVDEHKTVYSHAGLSNNFMRAIGAVGTKKYEFINELFVHKPTSFCFYNGDFSGYGQHPLQSCIWIRPQSLYGNTDNLQVVGHTQVGQINHPPKSERRGFYLIDCLPKQYLSCTNGTFSIEII
jgi:predicted phosphodiesterase